MENYEKEIADLKEENAALKRRIGLLERTAAEYEKTDKEMSKLVEGWNKTFDAISDLIFIQGKDSVIVNANIAFCDFVKLKREDVIGKKCYELVHRTDTPWPKCPAVTTWLDKKTHVEELYDPGIGVPILVSTSPIFDDAGELAGLVHIAKDISHQKNTENELRKHIKELEVFNKVTIGREQRIIELKKEIERLKEESGRSKK